MKFCIKCGNQMSDDMLFCRKCGTKSEVCLANSESIAALVELRKIKAIIDPEVCTAKYIYDLENEEFNQLIHEQTQIINEMTVILAKALSGGLADGDKTEVSRYILDIVGERIQAGSTILSDLSVVSSAQEYYNDLVLNQVISSDDYHEYLYKADEKVLMLGTIALFTTGRLVEQLDRSIVRGDERCRKLAFDSALGFSMLVSMWSERMQVHMIEGSGGAFDWHYRAPTVSLVNDAWDNYCQITDLLSESEFSSIESKYWLDIVEPVAEWADFCLSTGIDDENGLKFAEEFPQRLVLRKAEIKRKDEEDLVRNHPDASEKMSSVKAEYEPHLLNRKKLEEERDGVVDCLSETRESIRSVQSETSSNNSEIVRLKSKLFGKKKALEDVARLEDKNRILKEELDELKKKESSLIVKVDDLEGGIAVENRELNRLDGVIREIIDSVR